MNRYQGNAARAAGAGWLLLGLALGCGKSTNEPTPREVTSVAVSPALDTLVSLNETVQLAATAKDASGATMSGTTFSWSSEHPEIASVNDAGLVTGKANGATRIRAVAANNVEGFAALVVQQRPAAIEAAQGDRQGGTVGLPLDSLLGVSVLDALGSPVPGAGVTFSPEAGTADPAQGTADAAGRVTTRWNLGVEAGVQELRALLSVDNTVAVPFSATAFAEEPDSMFLLSGNDQFELPGMPLPSPIRIQVVDRYGNVVPDVPITFTVSGDGTLEVAEVFTDLDGIAAATWTLGSTLGTQAAEALLPDSAVGEIVDLKGSPVGFTAAAVAFAVGDVAPTPPVVAQSMTVGGMGFDLDPAGNAVLIDGVAATVTAASQTSLTVTVPSFGCTPAKERTVTVARAGNQSSTMTQVHPANALALQVGQTAILTDPADFCVQFLSAAAGTDEYLVGLTSTRRLNAEMGFVLSADDGVAPAPVLVSAASSAPAITSSLVDTPRRREQALRAWEEAFFAAGPRAIARPARNGAALIAAPAIGEPIALRVPDLTADPCNDFTAVSATVIFMGPRVVVATDAALPSDPLSQAAMTAALNAFIAMFGDVIYNVATTYFGLPTDLDQNGRITVLFSPAVSQLGVTTFTSAVDLLDRATCPASDEGEVIYVAISPEPTAASLAAVLQSAPPDLAHELTHVIQLSRRLSAGGIPLAAWLGEGQAELGTEIVGLAVRGDAGQMDYGAAVVNADAEASRWYRPRFDRLSRLFGWDGAVGTVTGAPERCSVFGFGGLSIACSDEYAPGAAWAFVRYVSDRIAANYLTGEAGFHRDLIGLHPDQDITALIEAVAGAPLTRLLVDWAIALYTDGRIAAAQAPSLQVTSWNLTDVYDALSPAQRLTPPSFAFQAFNRPGSVVGGGTAYTRIAAGGAHGALAVRVREALGAALGTELRPHLWVVRIR